MGIIKCTLHDDVRTFVIPAELLLECEILHIKIVEKMGTVFYDQYIFFPENPAVNEIMWKSVIEPYKPQIAIKYGTSNMRFAGRLTKAKYTHIYNI
jgi:hypothetical protein